MAPSDEDLIQKIAKRDAAAFESFLERHEAALRRHVQRMVRDADAADDLAQEAFLRVWTRAEQWKASGNAKAWLLRIGTNLALNHLRTTRRRKEAPLEFPAEPEDEDDDSRVPGWMIDASSLGPRAVAEEIEQREILWRMAAELPEEKREAMRLVYDAHMEIREAAEALGVPEGTVKSRLHHARQRLAQQWKEIENHGKDS